MRGCALSYQPDMHDDGREAIGLILQGVQSWRFETRYGHLTDFGPIKPEIPQATASGREGLSTATLTPLTITAEKAGKQHQVVMFFPLSKDARTSNK